MVRNKLTLEVAGDLRLAKILVAAAPVVDGQGGDPLAGHRACE
jgi:hypothetical protein